MYTLREVSERWRKSENDVLRMAVNDEIVFFVRLTCPVQEQESGRVPDDGRTTRINDAVGFVPVENHYIEDLLSGETAVDVGCFHTPGMTYFPLDDSGDNLRPFVITRERLMITSQELARIDQPVMPGKDDGQKGCCETPSTLCTCWQEIQSKSRMSRKSFEKYAEIAGVNISKNERGRVQITLENVLKVKFHKDSTKKITKK